MAKNECGFLSHGTQKSAVSQEWIDELSLFFTFWYKFRKAKNYFNNFLGGHCQKWVCSALKIDLMNWAAFLNLVQI